MEDLPHVSAEQIGDVILLVVDFIGTNRLRKKSIFAVAAHVEQFRHRSI